MERIVDDKTALPPNRILSAWLGKLQEVVVVGIDSYGKLVAASTASGVRAQELMKLADDEIDLLKADRSCASGMSAFGQDPKGLEAKPASPTRKAGDAPKPPQ